MMRAPRRARARLGLSTCALALTALHSLACTHGAGSAAGPSATAWRREDHELRVPLGAGRAPARVGATLWWSGAGRRPIAVLVPGAGRVSRAGRQPGDGRSRYRAPVETTRQWGDALAAAGMGALAFDKRTCGAREDPLCLPASADDFDTEGPGALAKDIDAACALARAHPLSDGRVVLVAHGQGVAPALAATCARQAAALVLIAPIPRGVDDVMVAAGHQSAEAADLAAGEQARRKNRAGSLEATFRALHAGAFAEDARIQGATLDFWRRWIALTRQTPALLLGVRAPRLLVVGEADVQFAPRDRDAIRALARSPGVSLLEIAGADHHLVRGGAVATEPVVGALRQILEGHVPGS